ncbi:MAG: hypothetical protein NTV54_01190 [Ignavibacteriales bacterium]|nr:hypothetical protein [Ignavibacteriales bacterium]
MFTRISIRPIKILLRHLLDQLAVFHLHEHTIPHDARIVDEHIDAAVALHHGINPCLDFFSVSNIYFVERSVVAECRRKCIAGSFIHIAEDDRRAFFCKPFGGCFSNAGSSTGD